MKVVSTLLILIGLLVLFGVSPMLADGFGLLGPGHNLTLPLGGRLQSDTGSGVCFIRE